jgi:methyltransferase-like protein
LATSLAQSFVRQVVEFYVSPPKVKAVAGDSPRASALARLQAAAQTHVTTQLHTSAALNNLARRIVVLADGVRDRADICAALRHAVEKGELALVDQAGQPKAISDLDQLLRTALDKCVQDLGRLGCWC